MYTHYIRSVILGLYRMKINYTHVTTIVGDLIALRITCIIIFKCILLSGHNISSNISRKKNNNINRDTYTFNLLSFFPLLFILFVLRTKICNLIDHIFCIQSFSIVFLIKYYRPLIHLRFVILYILTHYFLVLIYFLFVICYN